MSGGWPNWFSRNTLFACFSPRRFYGRFTPLPHHPVQPLLSFSSLPDVAGDHRFNDGTFIERSAEFFESLLGQVGEVAAVAVALEGAVFGGGVEVAVRDRITRD